MAIPSSTTTSNFHDCHHPDEYVDAAIFIYPESRESYLDLPSPKDILRFALVPLKRLRMGEEQVTVVPSKALLETNIINLTQYHLPDEYCDAAALFTCENDDGDEQTGPPSSYDIVSSFLSWLRYTTQNNNAYSSSPSLGTTLTSDMNLSNCHLPPDYIDSTVVCDSSSMDANDSTTSLKGDLFDSLASFLSRGNGESSKEESACDESPNNISMEDCDLPDEFVDAVIFCNDSDPVSATPLDHLNEKILQVLSSSSKQISNSIIQTNDKERKNKTSYLDDVFGNEVPPQRRVVWEKSKSNVSIGSLDAAVPKASSPRVKVLLRKRTPSKTRVCMTHE